MEIVNDILRDIQGRAEVAERQDGDATVHHSAVAAMLRDIADRLDGAHKRDMQAIVDAGEVNMRTAMDEVARLCKALKERDEDVRELLKCLKKVYDEECTDYGTGEVFNRISAKINNGGEA